MRYELNFDEDKVNDVNSVGGSYDLKECCRIMNEQQAEINNLEEEIDELEEEIDFLNYLIEQMKELFEEELQKYKIKLVIDNE